MEKLKKILLYAGLERDQFQSLAPDVLQANRKSLNTYALLAIIAFAGLFAVSGLTRSFADINQRLYGFMLLLNIFLYLCVWQLLPRVPALILPAGYLFMGGLYAFSLAVTALHPAYPAVSTVVFLFAVPYLLMDRPIRMIIMTALVVIAQSMISLRFKSAELASTDYWNAISFGAIAIVVETVQQCNKYRMLLQEDKLAYLSNTDVLTGAKNRNRFESRKEEYAQFCDKCLSCIYVDVNGLHALNDKEGHLAGDRLLIAASHALIDAFGKDDTYRIGGDEFVCFSADTEKEVVRQRMLHIDETLAKKGYSVSWGAATQEKAAIDMRSLTTEAEEEMYAAKRRYYQQSGHDRRSR